MEETFYKINQDIFALKPKKIAVAVSGGADSLSLVFLLKKMFENHHTQIYSFTVDHCLRAASTTEALKNKQLLNSHDIHNEILTWQHQKAISSNIQSLAREARYNLLINRCIELDIKYLFVGHNQDDLAENFLIRLRRGSGLDGLAAIKRNIEVRNIEIIRPLLNFTKLEIKSYLKSLGIEWFEDPSNKNTDFERVKVRNMLQGEELLSKRIATASYHLRLAKDYLETKIKQTEQSIVDYNSCFNVIKIELAKFIVLTEYEKFTILSNSLQFIGNKVYKPRFDRLSNVMVAIMNGALKKFSLHSCIITIFKNSHIIICKESNNSDKAINAIKVDWEDYIVDTNDINNFTDLTISSLGQSGWQKFDNKDIIPKIILENFPKIIFYALPVVKRLEKIVSIPHLNYYREEIFKDIKISRVTQK